ncbi:hypothetical protein HHK36_007355 [Tetracentron sinense]|uniref:Uncharacterized protein n=1 Tax=Tetracentron sinense TaxID=13715 RepID=A0A835DLQ8_TETSI|nr:hypothetical protein HHK36_007355 [Tetracentron sinense]
MLDKVCSIKVLNWSLGPDRGCEGSHIRVHDHVALGCSTMLHQGARRCCIKVEGTILEKAETKNLRCCKRRQCPFLPLYLHFVEYPRLFRAFI